MSVSLRTETVTAVFDAVETVPPVAIRLEDTVEMEMIPVAVFPSVSSTV